MPRNFACTYITHLDLSNNALTTISGLSQLSFLQELDLSYNQLKTANGMKPVAGSVTHLNLANNSIDQIEDLNNFGVLRDLNLEGNHITNLYNLTHCSSLRCVNLKHNYICGVRQMEYLAKLRCLDTLLLNGNTVTSATDFYFRVILRLENLEWLDKREVSSEDRIKAHNVYGAELEHRLEVHQRHVGVEAVPFENPFRVWELERDPPRLLVYATKAAGAPGQRFTFELWDEGEEFVIEASENGTNAETHVRETVVLKANDAKTKRNLKPVAVSNPFNDPELFLNFVTIATEAAAKADIEDRLDTPSPGLDVSTIEDKAAMLIQGLARIKIAREKSEAVAKSLAEEKMAAELLAAASVKRQKDKEEMNDNKQPQSVQGKSGGDGKVVSDEETIATATAIITGAAVTDANTAQANHVNNAYESDYDDVRVEASAMEEQKEENDKTQLIAAISNKELHETKNTETMVDVAAPDQDQKDAQEQKHSNGVTNESDEADLTIHAAAKALLDAQVQFENLAPLCIQFPSSANSNKVAEVSTNGAQEKEDGSRETQHLIIHWNENARFSTRFIVKDLVVDSSLPPMDVLARLSYGGLKKGFAVEMFLPPYYSYEYPQRVMCSGISESVFEGLFPDTVHSILSALERRHGYGDQLGKSGVLKIENGQTVGGVVLKKLVLRDAIQ